MSFADDEQLMERYLLGLLAADQRARIDERLMADPAFFERLEAFEDDMIVRWHFGRLSVEDRESFAEAYAGPARQARIEKTLRLIRIVAPSQGWSRPSPSYWVVAASLLLAVGTLAVLPRIWSSKGESATMVVALTAVGERSVNRPAGYDVVRLLPGVTAVHLQVDVPRSGVSTVPPVEIAAIDHDAVRQYGAPAVQWAPERGVVTVTVQVTDLPSGDYVLTVRRAPGESDVLVRRAFRVLRPGA